MSDRVMAPNNFTGDLREESWVIEGLDCPDCAASLEKAVAAMPGVAEARLSYASSKLKLQYAPLVVPRERIVASVRDAGYRVGNGDASTPGARPAMRPRESFGQIHQRSLLTAVSGVFLALGFLLSTLGVAEPAPEAAYLLGILVGGYTTARAALFALRARQMDMNVLMSAAVIGAVAIGEWTEAASVVFLFALANALQSYTMDHTRRSIRSLLELAPKEAVVLRGGEQARIPAEELAPGDILLVRPGEQIATDGVVAAGSSAVNQAPITGESVPVEKGVGDEVFAGTINQRGFMEVRVTRTYQENTLSRIIHMVEEAQAQKAPSQQFVDRFARYYTPAVIALAAAVAVVPPLFFGGSFGDWFYRALVLLIIACPCALVISTPVSIAAAIATAARNGVLFKGGAHLEALAAISVVAFDKTGTLTRGELAVTDVVTLNGLDRGEVLGIAAALEARSEHPLAEAVVRRAREEG
ncbi:MAG TPA: cation-translocating P-type ATPase, partial [Chloroflexota bacterium]|nr:cation-translocating P-type ATPase [Chloroflexota bacterium]